MPNLVVLMEVHVPLMDVEKLCLEFQGGYLLLMQYLHAKVVMHGCVDSLLNDVGESLRVVH